MARHFRENLLNNYTSLARKFEKLDLNVFDAPEHRDKLLETLDCMMTSPLGEGDQRPAGFELSFKGNVLSSKCYRKTFDHWMLDQVRFLVFYFRGKRH